MKGEAEYHVSQETEQERQKGAKGACGGTLVGTERACGRTLVKEHLILSHDSGSMLFYSVSPVC